MSERKRTVRSELIAELASILWSYSTENDDEEHLSRVQSEYREIDKLLSLIGEQSKSFESYISEVAPKSKTPLQNDNPQVRQDIECFREVKAVIDRADKLHEEAKKTRNRLQKRNLRLQAASLVRQAQEKVPELEVLLSHRYTEVKGTVMSRISGSLRYLEYSLERFLSVVPSQSLQDEDREDKGVILHAQNPLDGYLVS